MTWMSLRSLLSSRRLASGLLSSPTFSTCLSSVHTDPDALTVVMIAAMGWFSSFGPRQASSEFGTDKPSYSFGESLAVLPGIVAIGHTRSQPESGGQLYVGDMPNYSYV